MLRNFCKGDSWFYYYTIWDIAKEIIINVNSEKLSLDFIHLLKTRIIDINDNTALNYIKSLLSPPGPPPQTPNTNHTEESYTNLKYEFLSICSLQNCSQSQRLSILSSSEFSRRASTLKLHDIFDLSDPQLSFLKTYIFAQKKNCHSPHPSSQLNPDNYYTFTKKKFFLLKDLQS